MRQPLNLGRQISFRFPFGPAADRLRQPFMRYLSVVASSGITSAAAELICVDFIRVSASVLRLP